MSHRNDILIELKEISPTLLNLKENEKPLVIPADYFEQLVNSCLAEIETESSFLSSKAANCSLLNALKSSSL